MQHGYYDVVVVGAGHAGCEAALISSRMGVRTALITSQADAIARMSCNPSIGGMAKSHIVADLDAMGGEMAQNADFTGIQFRTLNKRKGPAVQATRIQCDKHFYSIRMKAVVSLQNGLDVIEDLVIGFAAKSDRISEVICKSGRSIETKALILSPGTFLNGRIFIGRKEFSGGRIGEQPAVELSKCLSDSGFKLARLKTGTPPRLHKDSIDYDQMKAQPGEDPPPFLSHSAKTYHEMFHVEQPGRKSGAGQAMFHVEQGPNPLTPWVPGVNQMVCHLTHTTADTESIVKKNLAKSALYGGLITGTGARYCPSIEDKYVKFPDHESHHIFIEPEGRIAIEVYPNGTSNSLPEAVQLEMIRSIPGLHRAEMVRPGYAIEYDFVDPTQLTASLESKQIEGLFLAGQLIGTTGYEEAAGLGFVAGVNAAFKVKGARPMFLSRSESYIGVMIDDLITKGTSEPYRMFTSRAEHRLMLRQDNGPFRLFVHAEGIGVVPRDRLDDVSRAKKMLAEEISRLDKTSSGGSSLSQILCRSDMNYENLPLKNASLPESLARQVEVEVKYRGYIEREMKQIVQRRKQEGTLIPNHLDYDRIIALRFEAREKLKKIRPANLGQASRISGVNPSDISILAVWIGRMNA